MNEVHTLPTANGSTATAVPSLGERVRNLRLPDKTDARGERATSPWLPWALCLLLGASTVSLAVRSALSKPSAATPTAAATTTSDKTPGSANPQATPRGEPEAAEGEVLLETKGYFTPAHQISVSPIGVNGRIERLEVKEGKFFKKGEVLAEIDASEFVYQVEEAKANLSRNAAERERLADPNRGEEKEQAKSRLNRASSELLAAQREFDRVSALSTQAGIVSRKEFDDARMMRDSRQHQVDELREAMKLSNEKAHPKLIEASKAEADACEARLGLARWRLGNCKIVAPVDGWVLSKKAEIGNLINAAFFSGSTSLCEMADLSDLEVQLDVQERDIRKVRVGGKCKIRSDAWPDRVYDGEVDRIMPIADRSKGSVEVRVKVLSKERLREEEGQYLKPNLGAVVTFLAGKK